MEIDYESPLPAYRQIADDLRRQIGGGRWQRRLPSEAHLQQEYGVARDTIRRAIAHLAELGLVHTVSGRGTFVRALDTVTVTLEPGMRIVARRATEGERTTMQLDEDAWVLVVERAGGVVETMPAETSELRTQG